MAAVDMAGIGVASGPMGAPSASRAKVRDRGHDLQPRKMCKTVLGFVPAQSPIYAFHPTTRLLLYVFMSFLPLVFQTPELELALVALSVLIYMWAGVPARNLKMYVPMLILVFFFVSVSYIVFPSVPAGEAPIMVGPVAVYASSLIRGLLVYTRVIALLFATIVYFSTNRERDILVALRCLHVPFVVSYFIGLVLRSAGTFIEDYRVVKEAEKARGLDMSSAPLLTKVTHFPMYMIPLFTLAIRRSEDISVGLYAKGTVLLQKDGAKRPDYMRTLYTRRGRDVALVAMLALVLVGCEAFQLVTGSFGVSHSVLNALAGGVL